MLIEFNLDVLDILTQRPIPLIATLKATLHGRMKGVGVMYTYKSACNQSLSVFFHTTT